MLQHREENGQVYRMDVDAEAQAMGHIERSKKAVEEMFEMGANVLTNMTGQRERLKVHPKAVLSFLQGEERVTMGRAGKWFVYEAWCGMACLQLRRGGKWMSMCEGPCKKHTDRSSTFSLWQALEIGLANNKSNEPKSRIKSP